MIGVSLKFCDKHRGRTENSFSPLADKPTEVISRLLNASADVNSATITSLEIPEGQVMVAQDVAVKAHVNDQFGNPVAHQPVTFSAEPSPQMIISQNTVST